MFEYSFLTQLYSYLLNDIPKEMAKIYDPIQSYVFNRFKYDSIHSAKTHI